MAKVEDCLKFYPGVEEPAGKRGGSSLEFETGYSTGNTT